MFVWRECWCSFRSSFWLTGIGHISESTCSFKSWIGDPGFQSPDPNSIAAYFNAVRLWWYWAFQAIALFRHVSEAMVATLLPSPWLAPRLEEAQHWFLSRLGSASNILAAVRA
ncbi:hypothetical protein OIU78_023234 [Salix suchowensis]|nr:hypothetical protein OIU78_023234 [Salix suchowensis]